MNTQALDAIAKAVLYEGYMLYPYRPSSVKNRQRFNFGVLYPRAYAEAQANGDAWSMQTECLIRGSHLTSMEIGVRFLKMVTRLGSGNSWQEGIEYDIPIPPHTLGQLSSTPVWPFVCGAGVGMPVAGAIEIKATQAAEKIYKLQIQVRNLTALNDVEGDQIRRDQALLQSLVSAHTLMGVVNGEFVSLLDPPDDCRELTASCQNVGTWPVLVGAEGERDTMLSSPIILYDYPHVAPESPGDLFDGAEIDEILSLRILTMTDAEKAEMRNADDRSRRMLERTESLSLEQLMKLHGTLRELRPLNEEAS